MIPSRNFNVFGLFHLVIGITTEKKETFLYCVEKSIDVSFSINLLWKRKSHRAMSEIHIFFKALWSTHWRHSDSSVSSFWNIIVFPQLTANRIQCEGKKYLITSKIMVIPRQVCLKLILQYGTIQMQQQQQQKGHKMLGISFISGWFNLP